MFQIDNHNEIALSRVIPYLLQFDEIYKLAEQSGDRAQIIEDIAWKLLYNLDYNQAKGSWLDYLGVKVGQDRTYTPKSTDAFTFGGTSAQGFGAGKFKSASSLSGTKSVRTDYDFRNAIRSKIIQNNTDTSLDELIQACKLLFNAKLVLVTEDYPANIDYIDLYGSNLIETFNANALIKKALPAGVSLTSVNFYKFYNLFKNNAFIEYNKLIPEINDFELTMTLMPNHLMSGEDIGIFAQGNSFISENNIISMRYNSDEGLVLSIGQPNKYSDSNLNTDYYNDEDDDLYIDSEGGLVLSGGTLIVKDVNRVKITRVGNTFSLYIDDILIDSKTSSKNIRLHNDNTKLYLGLCNNNLFYNSGSIYSLLIEDKTNNKIILNDSLKTDTIGINNGVKFI